MPLKKKNNFEELIENLSHVHNVLQHSATKTVDQFLSLRNWSFGYYIVEYEQNGEDRAKYGENLMQEIAGKLTNIKGLRFRQLYICKDFYLTYMHFLPTVSAKLQQIDIEFNTILRTVSAKYSIEEKTVVTKKTSQQDSDLQLVPELLLSRLTFSHFIELIRVKDELQRLFYEVEAIKNNWSVRELKRAINTSLAFRTTMSMNKEAVIAKIKNLKPTTNADIIRNPYILEFLDLEEKTEYNESDLEQQILNHLQEFLIELGTGFCFESRQKRITFDNKHLRMDLVFYHRILKCHVLIDLKVNEFDHTDAGQMNVYLNYYKANEMTEGDNPPVGIILCADKNDTLVEYATAGMDDRLFVSKYLVKLPEKKVLETFMKRELNQ
ncbi:MAG: PDDEXK nuclease domain-containing protein [Flavobacteriaceae bacterium]|jgi:predicted nuclease of restriction endonuclease-like (RecB) superfamily|nr:PDDEXK nuclease domain-containing protein [Flavobacteriaceae bacterium]